MRKHFILRKIKSCIFLVIVFSMLFSFASANSKLLIVEPTSISLENIEFHQMEIKCPAGNRAVSLFFWHDPETESTSFSPPVSFAEAYEASSIQLQEKLKYSLREIEDLKLFYTFRNVNDSYEDSYYQLTFFFGK